MEAEVIEALAPTHGLWQEHRELSKPYLNRFGQSSRDFEVLAVSQLNGEELTLFEWNAPLVAPKNRDEAAYSDEDEEEEDAEDQGDDRNRRGGRKIPTLDRESNGQDVDLRR